MEVPQIENKKPENDPEKISARRESKREYDQNRYMNNLEQMRKYRLDYYHANKDKISEERKKRRKETNGVKQRGRPKKYETDG